MSNDPFKYFSLAKELNEKFHSELSCVPARFRGSKKSIQLISLHQDSPQLKIKIPYRLFLNGKGIGRLHYLKQLNEINMPGRPTPEKQVQSWILVASMKNGRFPFDQNIILITDEFAQVRNKTKLVADIFGFNQEINALSIIELKSKRLLTEITTQLDNCASMIQSDLPYFKSFLKAHGFEWQYPYKIEKIAIWPSNNAIAEKRFPADIREFGYYKDGNRFNLIEKF